MTKTPSTVSKSSTTINGMASFTRMPTASVVAGRAENLIDAALHRVRKQNGDQEIDQIKHPNEPPDPADMKGKRTQFHDAIAHPIPQPMQVQKAAGCAANADFLRLAFNHGAVSQGRFAADGDQIAMHFGLRTQTNITHDRNDVVPDITIDFRIAANDHDNLVHVPIDFGSAPNDDNGCRCLTFFQFHISANRDHGVAMNRRIHDHRCRGTLRAQGRGAEQQESGGCQEWMDPFNSFHKRYSFVEAKA